MEDLDLSGISPALFVTISLFLILILSFFSLVLMKALQRKLMPALLFSVLGVASIIIFVIVLRVWF